MDWIEKTAGYARRALGRPLKRFEEWAEKRALPPFDAVDIAHALTTERARRRADGAARADDPVGYRNAARALAYLNGHAPRYLEEGWNRITFHTGPWLATSGRNGKLYWERAPAGSKMTQGGYADRSRGPNQCRATIDLSDDRAPEKYRRTIRHELVHCTIVNVTRPPEKEALLMRIADQVALEPMASRWYGQRQAGDPTPPYADVELLRDTVHDTEALARAYGRATSLQYVAKNGSDGDPTRNTIEHPTSGERHVSTVPLGARALFVEEALVFRTTGKETTPRVREPPRLPIDTREGLEQHAHSFVSDIEAYNARHMDLDDLRKRNAQLIDPGYRSVHARHYTAEQIHEHLESARSDESVLDARRTLTRGTLLDTSVRKNVDWALDRIGIKPGTPEHGLVLSRIEGDPDERHRLLNDVWEVCAGHREASAARKEQLRERTFRLSEPLEPAQHAGARVVPDDTLLEAPVEPPNDGGDAKEQQAGRTRGDPAPDDGGAQAAALPSHDGAGQGEHRTRDVEQDGHHPPPAASRCASARARSSCSAVM